MRFDALVVPRGAEDRADERGWLGQRHPLLRVPAGALSGRAVNDGRPIATALVLGVCGALDPALHVGDPVVYREIADGDRTIDLDRELVAACANALGRTTIRAAAVASVVGGAADKAVLRLATGAAAIDMEAASLATAFHARGVRVAMVRVVTDDARAELPDLSGIYDERGALKPFALGRALLASPFRGAAFVRNALRGIDALRRTAERLSRDDRADAA